MVIAIVKRIIYRQNQIVKSNEIFSLAIEFENDKVTFYSLLRQFIEDKATRNFLESIITEEKNHIKGLQKFLETGATENAIMSEEQTG